MAYIRILISTAALIFATALQAQTQTPATHSSNTTNKNSETVKCKTRAVTGSLAQTVKECHTLAEWDKINAQGRSDADYYRQAMNSSRGN